MPNTRLAIALTTSVITFVGAGTASAQDFPTRPIRILTTETGGGSDFVSRLLAQGISGPLGQQVIVDNRAAIIAVNTVLKAAPNGQTLLLYGNVVWLDPLMRDTPRWDPFKDFSPVILTNRAPNVVAVHPSVAATSVKELIALAKAKPGQLNYGAGATGASTHLAAELFKSMAGVNFVLVSYKSSGAVINALLGGEVQIMFPTAGSVASHTKAGKLRALAVTSREPSALAPGLPPVARDLPGYESEANYAIFAPAGTPAAIVNRLNQEVRKVLAQPDVKERLFNIGIEIVGGSPADLTAKMKAETTRMGKVIKDAGIRAE